MRRFSGRTFIAAAALFAPALLHAQSLPAPDAGTIEKLASLARANLPLARVSDGSFVPPESPDELARPIIPAALVRQTVRRGFLTGEMEACGMDWNGQSFRPYMARVRAGQRYSQKQLAYIGLLHGIGQGTAAQMMAENGSSCSKPQTARLLEAVRSAPVLTP